jgi:hypothetical protein
MLLDSVDPLILDRHLPRAAGINKPAPSIYKRTLERAG